MIFSHLRVSMVALLSATMLLPILPAFAEVPASSTTPLLVPTKRRPADAEWTLYPARTVESLGTLRVSPPFSRWGGRTDRRVESTGFFRVKKEGDRWWLVDPDGFLFLHVAVSGIDRGHTDSAQAIARATYGTPEHWCDETEKMLRGLAFNGAGAWSDVALIRTVKTPLPLVYTIIGNTTGAPGGGTGGGGFMSNFGKTHRITRPGVGHAMFLNDCLPIFHPDFPKFCDDYARPLAALKDDPHLLGYFSDNELPMPRLDKYLALPPNDPIMGSSYSAAKSWLDTRKGKNATLADVTDEDRDAWTEYAYDRYFALTTGAIRRYDPNHLCLGSRFYGPEKEKPGAFRAAGKYLDAIGVNVYFVFGPKRENFTRWTEWSGKPFLVTEFYAKGMDSGLANTSGAGWTVPTQRDRGLFYQTFTLGLLETKSCVGWHWLSYRDNDPANPNAEASNRDANKGIVTLQYKPYEALTHQMRELNSNIYSITDLFDGR